MDETGQLRISVTEAGGTIPIEGAAVTISEYTEGGEGDVLRLLSTNRDGNTETVSLPTPPASDSLFPGSRDPGGLYSIAVKADGYYLYEAVGVPVFAGVTAVQRVNLVPIGAPVGDFSAGQVYIYETPEVESLEPGGLRREDIGNRNGTRTGDVSYAIEAGGGAV